MATEREKVTQLWGERSAQLGDEEVDKGYFWTDKAVVRRHINRRISGATSVDWIDYIASRHLPGCPLEHCLSLGCGSGKLERWLTERGVVKVCDAYDVSPGSIEVARHLAQEKGYSNIRYHVADIDALVLPEATYDAVWVYHAMHHLQELEAVCARIAGALKPCGLLILNEYIGPKRFQFPQRQVDVINLCLRLLPERYRRVIWNPGSSPVGVRAAPKHVLTRVRDRARRGELLSAIANRLRKVRRGEQDTYIRQEFRPPTVQQVIDLDPSEAIRSSEIVPVVSQYFEIEDRRDYGGNVLQFLMQDILVNFPDGDVEAEAYLSMIICIEEALLSAGELTSDFAVVVARPRRV